MDNVIQTIVAPGSVFGGSGSYPLEGGYLYFTPIGYPTLVYALGTDQNGVPVFSKVGQSPDNSAGRVGVGVPTITSYQGMKERKKIRENHFPDPSMIRVVANC